MSKKLRIIIYPVIVFFTISFCLLGGYFLVKKNILDGPPFFSENELRVPGTEWYLTNTQPVYLWSFSRDGGQYLKSLVISKSKRLHVLDIFIGGNINGKNIPHIRYVTEEGLVSDLGSDNQVSYPFKFGQRFRAEYFLKVNDYGTHKDDELCADLPNVCIIAEYVAENEAYYNFADPQQSKQKYLIAVQLYEMGEE